MRVNRVLRNSFRIPCRSHSYSLRRPRRACPVFRIDKPFPFLSINNLFYLSGGAMKASIIGGELLKCLSIQQVLRWALVVFAIPLVSRPIKAGKCWIPEWPLSISHQKHICPDLSSTQIVVSISSTMTFHRLPSWPRESWVAIRHTKTNGLGRFHCG